MTTVHVDLGDRSYPIYVEQGVLGNLADYLHKHNLTERLFIITDDNVRQIYGDTVLSSLQNAGLQAELFSVPAGENSKSLELANYLFTKMLEHRADRESIIIALGGGVVGDLAGFVAATFMRGIRFVQVPTTILAQVDSSVGGKVGINHPLGKNLIGAFYQPQFVLIDPATLQTLPEREIRAGCAEIIKYGYIYDRSFYDVIAAHLDSLFLLRDAELLEQALCRSCEIKAEVVSQDEKESGLRAILNFGHTVGHAIEAVTSYSSFLHGESIVHGMKAALYISFRAGSFSKEQVDAYVEKLDHFHAPTLPPELNYDALLSAMQKDKKRSSKGQQWVLLKDIGEYWLTRDVPDEWVKEAIDYMMQKS
jgi:3-dehydroquinate synthase